MANNVVPKCAYKVHEYEMAQVRRLLTCHEVDPIFHFIVRPSPKKYKRELVAGI